MGHSLRNLLSVGCRNGTEARTMALHNDILADFPDSPVLVVGGSPCTVSAEVLRRLAAGTVAVVAVDHGLDAVLAAGLYCDLFCGDADSIGVRALGAVRACERGDVRRIGSVLRYEPEKDDTDLGLALCAIASLWPDAPLACACMTGGRPDHALAVMGRLASWTTSDVILVEDEGTGRILHAPALWEIDVCDGATFSFVPLSPQAEVSERGMQWELDHKVVPLLGDLGISNVIVGDRATFEVHEGCAFAWLVR